MSINSEPIFVKDSSILVDKQQWTETELLNYQRLSEVVSSAWENPLIDDDTRKFRQDSLSVVSEIMSEYKKLHPNLEWAAMLCGSAVGGIAAADERDQGGQSHVSDRDYVLFVNDEELIAQLKINPGALGMNADFVAVGYWEPRTQDIKGLPVNAKALNNDSLEVGYAENGYVNTLFTPDEFTCGDLDIIKQIRLRAAKKMNHSSSGFNIRYISKYREVFEEYCLSYAKKSLREGVSDFKVQNKTKLRFIRKLLTKASEFTSIENIEGVTISLLIKLGALPRGNSNIHSLADELPSGELLYEELLIQHGELPLQRNPQSLRYSPVNSGFLHNNPSTYKPR